MATFESDDRARPDSLLKWVNTFGISVETFADLSSGALLLECLQTVLPELSTASGNGPWKIIMKAFEDFYGGSLEKSISLKDIQSSSDQEQLARVVVLLLLIAVQRKPNEDMIAKITTLDFWTQRDIMYYIESGLGKANSHTLVAGGFTSGIGDPLPDLEHHSFSFNLMQESPTSTDMTVTPTNSTTTACETFISDPIPTPTPLRRSSSHCLYPNRYYLGLESPAGLRWLQSPAITAMPGRSTSKKRVFPPDHGVATMEEEVLKLRHRVRVLERSLESETKISQDLYTEVCQKTYCLEQLEVHCNQLESQVEKLAELHDLQDELQQCREKLLATERSLTRSRNEVDALQAYKAKCATLEAEAEEFHCNSSKLSQYEQMVSDLDKKLLGISSEKRALELSHQTTMIKLQARNEEVERLMEQNRESLREVRELTLKCQALQETHDEALLQLEEKSEGEQAALQEKRRLDVEIEKLQNLLEVKESAFSRLTLEGDKLAEEKSALHDKLTLSESQIRELQTQFMAQESALSSLRLERDELVEEKAVLLDKCSVSESQLQNAKAQLKDQECTLSSLTFERDQLVETKTALQDRVTASESKLRELQTKLTELDQLTEEKAALLDKFSVSESQLQDVKVRYEQLERESKQAHNHYQSDLEALKDENRELQQSQEKSRADVSSLAAEKNELTEVKTILEHKLSLLESQLQELQTQLQVQESALSSITLERDELVETKTALQDRVALTESRIHELQTELTELDQEKSALLDKFSASKSHLQDVKTQLQVRECTLSSLTLERDELVKAKTALEERVTLSESKIHELQTELTELGHLTEEKAALLDQLMEEKAALLAKCSVLESQLQDFKAKYEQLARDLEQTHNRYQSDLEALKDKNRELQQSQEKSRADVSSLAAEKNELTEVKTILEHKLTLLESQLQTQLQVQESTLSSLTLERDKLVEAKTVLEERVTSSESKIHELETKLTELDQLTEEKAALLDKFSASKSHLQDVKTQLQVRECTLSSLTLERDELVEAKTALEERVTLSDSKIHELQTELTELGHLTEEKAALLDQLMEEKATLLAKCSDSESQLQDFKAKYVQLASELKQTHNRYQSDLEALKGKNRELQEKSHADVSSLTAEKNELTEVKTILEHKLTLLESQLQELQTQLQVQECTLSSLTLERDKLVKAKTALEERVTSSESRIHELQTKLTELDQLTEEKAALLDQLEEEKSALLDKFSASKSHLQDVKTQLQVRECTLSSLTLERDELVKAKTALEERVTLSDSKIHELQTELTELGHLTEEKSVLLDQLMEEKAALLDKCSALESQLQDVKTQLKVQMSTLASLTLERDKLVETKTSLENRVTSSESKIHELQSELTELDQLTEEKAALLDKYSVSESQLQAVKAKYEQLARELKQTHKRYQSDLETLRDKNRELQLKQEESYADLCKENHAILKKQTKLHEEVEELRGMQGEMTALCQQYKEALEKNKKLLAKEQHHGAKLASENKSLEAQLGFASQKLRDMEKRKNSRAASPPPLSRQSSSVSSFAPRMLSSYELQTNEEEFYSQLQDEFDNTVGSIPFEFDDLPTDNCIAEDSFRSLSKPIMNTNPRRATLAVPSFSSSHWHSSLTAIREDEEEDDGEDSRVRISELKRRNAKALPHLKSSYPIEMQVQPESPNNSDDCVRNAIHKGERKAPELNTNRSVDLQTTSKTAFLSTEAHSRKRTISSRKRAEEFPQPSFDPLTTSPLPTRRRTGAPPTPKDILARQLSQVQNSRHSTMTSTALKLREYLDHNPSNTLHDPKSTFDDPNPRRQSTVFEIAFSPPWVKRALPKRLQQQENTRVTLPKQSENKATKPSVPKPTASTATVTKSRPAHSRRPVLKSKN